LEANSDKINWYWLSMNASEGAIRLLEANQDKIEWNVLCKNTGVFDFHFDYVLK
jgi:hypothetical protein